MPRSPRDWSAAYKKFEAALAKDPQFSAAQNGMGWTLVHLGEHDKAIAQFRQLLKENPSHPGALNGVGQCLLAQGKLDEAEGEFLRGTQSVIDAFGEAEVVKKGATASWLGLVQTYLRSGDLDKADKWIERYLKYKPDDRMMLDLKSRAEQMRSEADEE